MRPEDIWKRSEQCLSDPCMCIIWFVLPENQSLGTDLTSEKERCALLGYPGIFESMIKTTCVVYTKRLVQILPA